MNSYMQNDINNAHENVQSYHVTIPRDPDLKYHHRFKYWQTLTYKVQSPKWVDRMMRLAVEQVASWSKDSTKVGCVIATADAKIAGTGYNGLLAYYDDELLSSQSKQWKNDRMIHAERNAMANMTIKSDEPLYMFISLPMCLECAKSICLNGNIKAVYALVPNDDKYASRWKFTEAKELLHEANIQYYEVTL